METLKSCPSCTSEEVRMLHESRDELVSFEVFGVWGCAECGLLFTNPRPFQEHSSQYYQSSEYISHNDRKAGLFALAYRAVRWAMIRYKLQIIKGALSHKAYRPKILDFGCGTGEFLSLTARRKWDAVGLEPNRDARTKAQSKGLKVAGTIEELNTIIDRRCFDVITMWHVLEHIRNPKEIISSLKEVITENGIIVVAVPEHKSYDALSYKEQWAAWDVPRHLFHYDTKSIELLMRDLGFELLSIHPLIFDALYISIESENRNGGALKIARGLVIGIISNFLAYMGKHSFSSQVYVFRRVS